MRSVVFYTPVYSPDDGGWYSELFWKDGSEAHLTKVVKTEQKAINAALRWARTRGHLAMDAEGWT